MKNFTHNEENKTHNLYFYLFIFFFLSFLVAGFIMITIAFGIIVIILIRATIRDYRRYLRFGPKYHILGMGRARERSQNSGQKWTS